MGQQAEGKQGSRYVGVRLDAEGQANLKKIIAAGLAETITDAIHLGLSCAAHKVDQ